MEENQTIKKLQLLEHSCSIIALSRMFPDIEYKKLLDVFKNNTENWTGNLGSGGVYYNEFSKILDKLGLTNKIIYKIHVKDNVVLKDFLSSKEEENAKKVILLISAGSGAFFVYLDNNKCFSINGEIKDVETRKVYCSWELKN